jgi:hypothetical protein
MQSSFFFFLFIIFCFMISSISFVSADINVIVVDTIGLTTNLNKIYFQTMERGTIYTTDPTIQSDNPFPFIIRNIGTEPVKIFIWQERAGDPSKGFFDSPSSYIKFWVEPSHRYPLPGTIWDEFCEDDLSYSSCVNDCPNNRGCFTKYCGFLKGEAGACDSINNAVNLPIGETKQVVAIGDLQPLPQGSEALLKFEIMAAMDEPSGAKSTILNIRGSTTLND